MRFWSGYRGAGRAILLWALYGSAAGQQLPSPGAVADRIEQLWRGSPALAAVAVVLPALVAVDRPSVAMWKPSPLGDALFGVARLYGERWVPVAIAVGLSVGGWIVEEEQLSRAGLAVGGATVLTAATVLGMKVALGRARPSVGAGSLVFRPPGWRDSYQSFPSGHAALAFTLSTALSQSFHLQPAVAGALYTLATLTALSRLYHRAHWISDVVVGAVVGYTMGWAVARAVVPTEAGPQDRRGGWMLLVPTGLGVSLYWR